MSIDMFCFNALKSATQNVRTVTKRLLRAAQRMLGSCMSWWRLHRTHSPFMTSLTNNPHPPSKKFFFFECRVKDLPCLLTLRPGPLTWTWAEIFPRKPTCV